MYRQICSAMVESLKASGIDEDQATAAAVAAAEVVRLRHGGQLVRVPKGPAFVNRGERNAAIMRTFDGRNIEQVCAAFQVSRRTVYRICRR